MQQSLGVTVWMDAVEKDMLLIKILYVISTAQVTSRGGIVSPGHCFNSKSVGTNSEACYAVDSITMKVKKHHDAYGKGVWRMRDQGPLCREGTPIDDKLSVGCCALDAHKKKCPIFLVPLPEVHDKTTEIDGLTPQQPFFEYVGLCQTIHGR